MNRTKRVLAALLMSAMLLTACGGQTEETVTGPVGIAVQVQEVERRDIFAESRTSGKISADNEAILMVASAAKCLEVYVNAGDTVTAGQKLCKLDLGSVLSNRNAARISYDSAVQNLEKTRAVMDAQVALQQKNLNTTQALYDMGAASRMELDSARLQLDNAQMQRSSSVGQLEAAVQQAKAGLEQLGTALDNVDSEGNLVAPIDGVLTTFLAVKDSFVTNTMPVAVIDGLGGMKVTTSVSEAVVPKLNIGDEAAVRVSATGETYTAVIRSVERSANMQTLLYSVVLVLPEEADGLLSGMFADVTFHTDGSNDAIVVPTQAILTKNEKQHVFVAEEGTARYVEVTTGLTGNGVTEVLTGLEGGEQLVTVGQAYLADGDAVRVVGGAEEAPEAAAPAEDGEAPAGEETADAAAEEAQPSEAEG